MRKRIGLAVFVGAGLLLALALAALVSPHASSAPDGLERVVQDSGATATADTSSTWNHAPAPDYAVPGVKHDGLSKALAGVLGTLAVFAAAAALALILRKRSRGDVTSARQNE